MVIFNELRINDDKSAIIIDCSVEDLTIYTGMYIKTVELYHYKNITSSGTPSNMQKVITVYENYNDDVTVKTVRRCVNETTIGTGVLGTDTIEKNIFFVRVICDGTMGPEISQFACGTDDTVDIGVVVDWQYLYAAGMGFVAAMDTCTDGCKSMAGYEQFILTWFGIKLALSACDFDQLAILWDRFLKLYSNTFVSNSSTCGCHA